MSITPLPSPPEPTDSTSQFNTKAFAWVAALDNFTTEANALTANVNALEDSTIVFAGQAQTSASQSAASATASANSATTALGHASAAAANTNAPLWVSGTTYAAGALVYSALDGRTYRRKTAGAGTTNPVSDSTNWTPLLLEVATLRPTIRPSLLLDFANTKRLDSRVTFTRASTATYYGTQTAKAEENLLTYSQDFVTVGGWNNSVGSTIISSSEIAPNGTATATKFTADSGASSSYRGRTNTGVTVTNYGATINLSTGATALAFGTLNGSITATEFPAGSGWYRIVVVQDGFTFSFYAKAAEYSFAGVQVTANTFRLHACNQSGNFTLSPAGDGTKGILIWGGQLEARSQVTAYTPTTTQPITNYIPVLQTALAGVPRFDHNPTTFESLGLLVEEQRANLVTYSEDFANAAWTKTNSTITSNTIVAPDGTLTGDKYIANSGQLFSNTLARTGNISKAATATTYTSTVIAKAGELNRIFIQVRDSSNGTNSAGVQFNLTDGTIAAAASAGGTFTAATATNATPLGNGWYRCNLTFTSGTETNVLWQISARDSVITTGDGYSGIYIWGAQLEAGAFPTSYIPTVASQVTRSADAASITGSNFSSWYRADEGTVYAEGVSSAILIGSAPAVVAEFDDSTTSNEIAIFRRFSSYQPTLAVITNGNVQTDLFVNISWNSNAKVAAAFKTNDFAISYNASAVEVDTSGTLPVVDRFRIGARSNGARVWGGTIKRIAYYPARLTNAQLQAITG